MSGDGACLRQDNAGQHVTEGQKHWVPKSISSQHMLIEEHDANVGSKPAGKHVCELQSTGPAAICSTVLTCTSTD